MCQVACTFEIVNGERSVLRSVREAFSARGRRDRRRPRRRRSSRKPCPLRRAAWLLRHVLWRRVSTSARYWTGSGAGSKPTASATSHGQAAGARTRSSPGYSRSTPSRVSAQRTSSASSLSAARSPACWLNPGNGRSRPQTAIDAKFSLPFTAATALLHGDVTLDSFARDRLSDRAVLALSQRVQCDIDPRQADNTASVLVETREGAVHREFVSHVPGDPGQPLDSGALERKFRHCATLAARRVSASQTDRLVQLISALEHVTDVSRELSPLFAETG